MFLILYLKKLSSARIQGIKNVVLHTSPGCSNIKTIPTIIPSLICSDSIFTNVYFTKDIQLGLRFADQRIPSLG